VGQGTLGPLLESMRVADPIAFKGCFDSNSNYDVLEAALSTGNQAALFSWATTQQAQNRNWKQSFANLGDILSFQEMQVDTASAAYHPGVLKCVEFLRTISPILMNQVELQSYCAFYDLAVQQNNLHPAISQIKARYESEKPTTQRGLVKIALEERARKALPQYVSDCMSRRLGILQQSSFASTENGITRRRTNANFELISRDATKYVCNI